MRRQSSHNGFDLEGDGKNLKISRNKEELVFASGQTDKLVDIIGILQKMRRLPVFPPEIKSSPFKVKISETEGISLGYTDKESKEFNISWDELDNFIEAVYTIQKINADILTLGKGGVNPSSGGFSEGLSH